MGDATNLDDVVQALQGSVHGQVGLGVRDLAATDECFGEVEHRVGILLSNDVSIFFPYYE